LCKFKRTKSIAARPEGLLRILVLTINYWPEQTGIGAVLTRRCEYLASAGHEVTVCTGMPYYPEWQIDPAYKGKLFFREKRNGVTILRSWIWVPKKVTSAKRILFEASFLASSLLQAFRRHKPQLLLVVSPPLGLAVSAVLLSRWAKIPFVFDVQDLQPDAAADLGMLPGPVLPVLYRLEAMAYRKATLITTVTEGMRQRLLAKGVPAKKVVVAPPPADNSLFGVGSIVDGDKFRTEHELQGKFIIAHSGNMGVKQGLGTVVEAARELRDHKEFVFLLIGDGVMKSQLQNRVATLNLGNVRFLPVQQRAELLQTLAATDLALIVQQSTVSDIVFPSKTVTLLSASRPVVAAVSPNSEIGRVIRQSNGGVVIEPEKAEALVATVQELFHSPARCLEMGEFGRRYALQHWDEAHVLPSFESHLLKVGGTCEGQAITEEASVISVE
jgi:colanic acid biosynthesis glycosyl transferase WcaI